MVDRQPGGAGDDATAAFVALVIADETMHARLAAIDEAETFVAEAVAIAAAQGLLLKPDAVRAAIRPDPVGIGRFMGAPVTLDRWPGRGWLPARSVLTGGAPAFDWAWFGPPPLSAPFFEETVRDVASRPFNLMFRTRTTMAAIVADAPADQSEPAGFVFHLSRCGSTLVAQMLGADPANVVLSEPEPLDAAIRWALVSGAPVEAQVVAIRAVTAALGRDRSGARRRVFVKLDCWHMLALPLLRAAFPATPWVFLHRDPVEVLVSQQRGMTMSLVAGMLPPAILGIDGAETMDPLRHAVAALARVADAVLEHWSLGGGLLIDYRELPDALATRIIPHFGLNVDAALLAAMMGKAADDAKAPGRRFTPDAEGKRSDATPAIRELAALLVAPTADRLRALSDSGAPSAGEASPTEPVRC